jgi:hypothetical protein
VTESEETERKRSILEIKMSNARTQFSVKAKGMLENNEGIRQTRQRKMQRKRMKEEGFPK